MTRQIVAGIDIGTSEIKAVIAEGLFEHSHFAPKIIGTGVSESKGVYRGYITHPEETIKSIRLAVARAEKMAGVKIKRAYVSFGGVGLGSIVSNGSTVITRADMEITERDLNLALEAAEKAIPSTMLTNKRIINTAPIEYKIDGKAVWGQALGLKGQKLEVKALFITCLEHHLSSLISTVEDAGVEVVDVVAAPIASSFVTLSKKQKRVGCLLADFGAETLSIVVYENNNLISLEVFSTGGNDITNDIALGLKVSIEDAERVKLDHERRLSYSKKKLEEVVASKVKESFEQVEKHLRSIGRHGLLPAGIILTGGAAFTTNIKRVAESTLKLPAQIAEIHFGNIEDNKIRDNKWSVACGLVIVGFNADNEQLSLGRRSSTLSAEDGKRWGQALLRMITQFLP